MHTSSGMYSLTLLQWVLHQLYLMFSCVFHPLKSFKLEGKTLRYAYFPLVVRKPSLEVKQCESETFCVQEVKTNKKAESLGNYLSPFSSSKETEPSALQLL